MTATDPQEQLRTEYSSLEEYLRTRLTDDERARVLIASFSHWRFTMAAVAETALCLQEMGSDVRLALWANRTPLHDEGWSASAAISRALLSRSPEMNMEAGLRLAGIPRSAFVDPPIPRWRPGESVRIAEPMNRSRIRALTYRGTPMGRAILQVHPDRNTPITDDYFWPSRWVEQAGRSYAYVFDQASELIRREGVSAVMVSNGRFLHDRAVVEAATAVGIPVLASDLGGTDCDFDLTIEPTHDWRAFQRRVLAMYDSWDQADREVLASGWFLDRAQHADPMNATFVDAQERGSTLGVPTDGRLVVFFSSSGDEMAELEFDWSEYFENQGTALKVLADACRARPGHTLVVRSHPHKRLKPDRDLADWMVDVEAAAPDVHLDPFSPVDSYALMRQADVVVTYGSTTGVEAAFAGKPVIVMGPSCYDELGCVTLVHDAEQLGAALDAAQPGSRDGALAFGLMMKRRGFTCQRVQRDATGSYSVGGVRFDDVRPIAMHASHLRGRIQRWNRTRR